MIIEIKKRFAALSIILSFFLILKINIFVQADELHTKNKEAAKHYNKGNYEEALKSYDNLVLEFPQEPKLKINKGSVQYKLGNFDKADESYNAATSTKDKKALADLYYNLGNTQYMQADRMASQGDNKAMDTYKAALENYIKSLDIRPSDKDTKWNVQLTQKKMKQMQQQQQQNNKDNKQNKDNKDQKKDNQQQNNKDQKQDKKNQDQKKDQNNKQDDKKQDQLKKDDQQQSDKDQKQNQDKQKPEPTPQQQKQDDMKKDEAKRLIEQFSDDEKDLNKKPEKIGILKNKNIEKDW
jgi:Ca-activated chloride channel family protein